MRRLVALVIALMLVGSMLVGCGGGDEAAAPPEEQAPAATPKAAEKEPAALPKTPVEGQVFEPFPATAEGDVQIAPDAIRQRLTDGQPMVVFFYDSTQKTSDDQSDIIKDVTDDYRGLIDLVKFDVSKYVKSGEDGEITIVTPAKLNEGSEDGDLVATQVAKLISENYLNVKFTPYTVLVDHQGYITFRMRGVVDDKSFEREVLRATQ
ncbi:MAG: hypothetical protein Q8K99_01235 [Actinomycetota bacterium]|nr:hypothetical protein [Actinomycetota bacterium]